MFLLLQAQFLNAFVRKQRSRQNVKAGKSAWLEDERMLRQQERSLEDDVQKRFECMAVSWLPSADASQYRQNLEEAHTDETHLRMNRQCIKERAKAGHFEPGQAASLARHEVQLAATLEQQAASLQHEIKCAVSIYVSYMASVALHVCQNHTDRPFQAKASPSDTR